MGGSAGPPAPRFYQDLWDGCDTFITHYVYMQRNVRMAVISCGGGGVDLLQEVEAELSTGKMIITDY